MEVRRLWRGGGDRRSKAIASADRYLLWLLRTARAVWAPGRCEVGDCKTSQVVSGGGTGKKLKIESELAGGSQCNSNLEKSWPGVMFV